MLPVLPTVWLEVMVEDLHLWGGSCLLPPPPHRAGLGGEGDWGQGLGWTSARLALPQHQRSLRLLENWFETKAARGFVMNIKDGIHLSSQSTVWSYIMRGVREERKTEWLCGADLEIVMPVTKMCSLTMSRQRVSRYSKQTLFSSLLKASSRCSICYHLS